MKNMHASENNRSVESLIASREMLRDHINNKEGIVIAVLGAQSAPAFKPWRGNNSMQTALLEKAREFLNEDALAIEIWADFGYRLGVQPLPSFREQALAALEPEILVNVLSKVGVWRGEIAKLISESYSRVGETVLSYELISHALKHGIIDHVISLNFDPLLDESLKKELGEDVHLIFSDFQSRDVDGTKPCVFKLHGTTTYPETMKFSVEDTGGMYPETRDAIRRLIEEKGEDARVFILSYGYSWVDPDMYHWLHSLAPRLSRCYITTLSRNENEVKNELEARLSQKNVSADFMGKISIIRAEDLKGELSQAPSAGEIMWSQLLNAIEESGSLLERHIITSKISEAHHKNGSSLDPLEHAKLEFMLHITKSKGMAIRRNLAADFRVNNYFESLDGNARKEFLNWVNDNCVHESEELRDVFYERDEGSWNFEEFLPDLIGSSTTVCIPGSPYFESAKCLSAYLDKCLTTIRNSGSDTEISCTPDESLSWMFENAQPITTRHKLNFHTGELMRKSWTHLLSISESGEWITRAKPDLSNKTIGLITASVPDAWKWGINNRDKIDAGLMVDSDNKSRTPFYVILPWWLHNQHMTLWADTNKSSFYGIYFRRGTKTNRIAPTLVEGSDCLELLILFIGYLKRVENRKNFSGNDISRPKDFQSIVEAVQVICTSAMACFKDDQRSAILSRLMCRDPAANPNA